MSRSFQWHRAQAGLATRRAAVRLARASSGDNLVELHTLVGTAGGPLVADVLSDGLRAAGVEGADSDPRDGVGGGGLAPLHARAGGSGACLLADRRSRRAGAPASLMDELTASLKDARAVVRLKRDSIDELGASCWGPAACAGESRATREDSARASGQPGRIQQCSGSRDPSTVGRLFGIHRRPANRPRVQPRVLLTD